MEMSGLRILVVDDNSIDLTISSAMLKSLGIGLVQQAKSVSNAKFKLINAQAARASFHLVLCDWEMPTGDGLALLQYMRNDERFVKVGMIIMTATPEPERVGAAIKHQATDFIVKPLELEKLKEKLVAFAMRG